MLCVSWAIAAWCPYWFITDMLASLAAQGVIVAILALCVCAAGRRWLPLGLSSVGLALLLGLLLWSHRGANPHTRDGIERFPLRVLVFNFFAQNAEAQRAFTEISAIDADLMAWAETPGELIARLRWDTAFRERYPYRWLPDAADTGFPILLSRWPLLTRRSDWEPVLDLIGEPGGFLLGVVDHPEGQFIAVWMSPLSPRYPERWAEGNRVVRNLRDSLDEWFGEPGIRNLPVVVLGDQNATPTSWRSRYLLRHAGLRRAKPLWKAAGTFPHPLRWPFLVAIDDALICSQIVVREWSVLEAWGSDHLPVVAELLVPGGGRVRHRTTHAE